MTNRQLNDIAAAAAAAALLRVRTLGSIQWKTPDQKKSLRSDDECERRVVVRLAISRNCLTKPKSNRIL